MRNTSFNIFHLAVVALIVMVSIAVLFPIMRSEKRDRGRSWHSTQLRGIHQGLVTFANSNKNWYPGLDSQGNVSTEAPDNYYEDDLYPSLHEQVGIDVQDRFAMLIAGYFFTPEYAVSPSEIDPSIQPFPESGPLTSSHYSYAMLQVPTQGGRHQEWRQSLNSQAIVLSDRNTGTSKNPRSIHSDADADTWRGLVLWNDNHVGFENEAVFETKYFSHELITADHLFQTDGDDDAYLVHTGN